MRRATFGAAVVELYLNRFLRTFGAGELAYTFCEPADEVLPAHHNGDTAGSLEKKLIGRHPPGVRKDRLSRDVIIIIIVHPFASRDLVFATNQGAVASIRERSLPPIKRAT
jgi:hypothetical protein